jgi:hypothetical protein
MKVRLPTGETLRFTEADGKITAENNVPGVTDLWQDQPGRKKRFIAQIPNTCIIMSDEATPVLVLAP